MKNVLVLVWLVGLGACVQETLAWEEIKQGRPAKIEICGDNWVQSQLNQLPQEVSSWARAGVLFASGEEPFERIAQKSVYGLSPALYDEESAEDELHCIYLIGENYPTEAGRKMFERYALNEEHRAAGVTLQTGDILIIDLCPIVFPDDPDCKVSMSPVVRHELGHTFGLGDLECGKNIPSVMACGGRGKIEPMDREMACDLLGCP